MKLIWIVQWICAGVLIHRCQCTYDCIKYCACEKRDELLIADCRGLNFTEVPQPDPEYQVNILYLQYNRIDRLRGGSFNLYEKLTELYVQGNRMDTIEENAFEGLGGLEKIDLSKNMISIMPEDELRKLTNLRWISVSMNAFRAIPGGMAGLARLQELDLSSNHFIKDIPADSLPPSLIKLDMRQTGVKYFKKAGFSTLPNLKILLMSDNMARVVDFEEGVFDRLQSLEYMDMSRCYCKRLPRDSFTKLHSLNTLLLNHCWLENLPILARRGTFDSQVRADVYSVPEASGHSTTVETPTSTSGGSVTAQATTPANTGIWYNPALSILDVANNRLTSVRGDDVRFPPSLLELRLGYNNIQAVDDNLFNETTSIQKLDLCHAKLKTIAREAFMKFSNVSEICLSGNPITAAPRLPPSLLRLNLSETKITNLTGSILGELIHVLEADLKNGEIRWIEDHAFGNMTSLTVLDLSQNELVTLTVNALAIGTFEYDLARNKLVQSPRLVRSSTGLAIGEARSAVKEINLSKNPLQAIEKAAFSTHRDLQTLDLQGNMLLSLMPGIFAGLSNLLTLLLNNNKLIDVLPKTFQDLGRLEVLDLQRNNLEVIYTGTFHGLTSLKRLDLSHNLIIKIHEFASASLEYLDFSANNMTVFPRVDAKNLGEIIASANDIDRFHQGALNNLPALEHFELSHCRIEDIDYGIFASTPRLRHLDIAGNYLSKFPDVRLPALEVLNMGENEIVKVDVKLKDVVPMIQRLDISYNNISYLNPNAFTKSKTLRALDLIGNNFQCTCELFPFVEWMERNLKFGPVDIVDGLTYLCEGPVEQYTVPVLVAVTELNCNNAPQTQKAEVFIVIVIAAILAVIALLLLTVICLRKSRARRGRRENGDAVLNRDDEVIVTKPGCCQRSKQWCFSYQRDGVRRGRNVSEEQDLMISSPVTTPTETQPPMSL